MNGRRHVRAVDHGFREGLKRPALTDSETYDRMRTRGESNGITMESAAELAAAATRLGATRGLAARRQLAIGAARLELLASRGYPSPGYVVGPRTGAVTAGPSPVRGPPVLPAWAG